MLRIGIILSLYSAILSAPPSLFRPDADALSIEGLDYILRKAGNIFQDSLSLPDIPKNAKHMETSLTPPTEESFNFYLPSFNDNHPEKLDARSKAIVQIAPPRKNQEPNYYSRKQKKYPKKYTSAIKLVNVRPTIDHVESSDELLREDKGRDHKITFDDSYFGVNAQIPVPAAISQKHLDLKSHRDDPDEDDEEEEGEAQADKSESHQTEDRSYPTYPQLARRNGGDDERIEYQMHGFDGPKSYKFGYDTGKGKDRHFRFEERDKQGEVKGEYGYLDKQGKMVVVKYSSTADRGFQVENFH